MSSSAGSTSCARPFPASSTASASGATSHYYPVSISCRTLIYKGMFLADQLGAYYPDLHDPDFESALALVHQRFSTNTFPTWSLAHPYRMIAHNGEINTLRGNNNWMAARQASVSSPKFGDDINKLWPISYEGQSDTACFDNALEFLAMGGYSLAHAMMMMIPEAWAGNPLMNEERRDVLRIQRRADGAVGRPGGDRVHQRPADRRHARPQRLAAGALYRHPRRPHHHGVRSGRAADSGRTRSSPSGGCSRARCCWSISTKAGSFPTRSSSRHWPKAIRISEWLERTQIVLEELPAASEAAPISNLSLLDRQQAFGYTQEDLKILMTPMATTGEEAVGSMGNDTPISALSDHAEAALHLFQAELRPGDQPADRSDPRRTGDEPRLHHRAAAEPVRSRRHVEDQAPGGAAADPHQCRLGKDPLDFRSRPRSFQVANTRYDLAGRSRRRRHGARPRYAVRRGRRRRTRRHQHHHPVRPPRRRRPHSRFRRCSRARPCITI